MHVHFCDKLSYKLANQAWFSSQNGIESNNPQQELMLFRHHFFQPGLLLRHHQEQMKLQQQQQLLSQWFQKEDQDILLKDGTCQWPGCEKNQFASKATFQHHLNNEHALSQCSAAQVCLSNTYLNLSYNNLPNKRTGTITEFWEKKPWLMFRNYFWPVKIISIDWLDSWFYFVQSARNQGNQLK